MFGFGFGFVVWGIENAILRGKGGVVSNINLKP